MIIIFFRMENPADHRTADAPDIVGGQARMDRLDRVTNEEIGTRMRRRGWMTPDWTRTPVGTSAST